MRSSLITTPDHPLLDELCEQLVGLAPTLDSPNAWPEEQLRLCGEYGVFAWFVPTEFGGLGWSEPDVVRGYLKISRACLTTTFVITQRTASCQRILASDNRRPRGELIEGLLSGRLFTTLAVSHLTTSRRHFTRPVLRVEPTDRGVLLDGFSPWVTGASHAHYIVTGATQDDGLQLLLVVPRDLPGVSVPPPESLVALTASQTGRVKFDRVELDEKWILAGPSERVTQSGRAAGTGGLQTSTLAVGLADAAIDYIEREVRSRLYLSPASSALRNEWRMLRDDLLKASTGHTTCSNEQLRTRANSLALRATQSALAAAKGTGFVAGHPVGRWCREALFFLVWSCPETVLTSNLCELAGIEDS